MADALKLTEVSRDKGFRERVAYFLAKKAKSVLGEGTPDPVDLAFAKLVTQNINPYIQEYSLTLVTVDGVATALAATTPPYTHTEADDAEVETAVNAMYSDFAKGYE